MIGWNDGGPVEDVTLRIWQWPLVILRLVCIAVIIFVLMIPLILFRLCGFDQSGALIVQSACKLCLRVMGMGVTACGDPMKMQGAVVANHSSWLDIFTLNSIQTVYFVSKSDVASWPLIGLIARSTGAVFIRRKASDAAIQKNVFLGRISNGDRLLFFPEGTSTDGRRVLPFRSSLFAAFFMPELASSMWVQPVSVSYFSPDEKRADYYGWWGDMDFAPHFLMVLAQWHQGRVHIVFHDPLRVGDFKNRKLLAAASEAAVRAGMDY